MPDGSLQWHYWAGALGVLRGVYAHATATKAGLTVRHIGSDGELLFTAPTLAPRARQLRA